jgi:type IV secretion system protein VirB6/type IV secretion system protein TrbL
MSGKKALLVLLVVLAVVVMLLPSLGFSAESSDMVNAIHDKIKTAAGGWTDRLREVGIRLFWYLVVISLVWTFGSHAFSGSFNIGALFYEFIKFTVFVGFWKFSLDLGFNVNNDIIKSFFQLGTATGGEVNASSVLGKGFDIYYIVMQKAGEAGWADYLIMMFLALFILIVVAIVAANLLVLICAGTVLCYAGIFYFGFGGSRWTSDIAVNYYKSILGIAINIFATLLIIDIAQSVFVSFAEELKQPDVTVGFQRLAAIFVGTIIMALLAIRVPPMLSGIVSAPTGSIEPATSVGQAVYSMRGIAGGAADAAWRTARGGSNAAAAIASAREKMRQNMAMNQGFVSGDLANSSFMRGLDTASTLGKAMYQNFRQGSASGGVSRIIDDMIYKNDEKGAAQSADGADKSADASAGAGYVSSVPGDADAFNGGKIGVSTPGDSGTSGAERFYQGMAAAATTGDVGSGSAEAKTQGVQTDIDRGLGQIEAGKARLT